MLSQGPSPQEVEAAVATLKMLAEPTRLRILWALLHGEHGVNELADHLGAVPSTVSQHLAKLRLAGLVRATKRGTQVLYRAEDDHIERLAAEALFRAGHDARPGKQDHHRAPIAEGGA